ncbi:MAG TPA: hypothetical protein DEU72_05810, partial [Desulfomicrobiaceae bacterium]|nr:hypothetical protein [Desulfomicrobiaceae bacterium]
MHARLAISPHFIALVTIAFLAGAFFPGPASSQPAEPPPISSDGRQQGAADAKAREALRGLAQKNALTVRALIGYGRLPATAMAPLAGLRAKGI